MKASLLHHLGAPCRASIKKLEREPVKGPIRRCYLNTDSIIRFEPGGATITPRELYASFVHVDKELAQQLKKGYIDSLETDAGTLQLLTANRIIGHPNDDGCGPKTFTVSADNLPSQVLLDVTNACNCSCITCYHKADLNGYAAPIASIFRRVQHLRSLGLSLFEVTGGEPTLRPDIADILYGIDATGAYFYLVTNGEYLGNAGEHLFGALKRGLGLAVSLDGVNEIHDSVRHRPGLYAKLLKGLDRAASEGVKIYLVSTLSKQNADTVAAMIEVAKRYNTTIHLRPAINTGAAAENDLQTAGLNSSLTPYLGDPNVRNGLLSTKKSIPEADYYGCGIRKRISVSADGFLFPCVMDRSRPMKKIEEYGPAEIIAELERETQRYLGENSACRDCEFNKSAGQNACGGFCRFSRSHKKGLT